ncbi:MAG: helix-turn-helix domain-containing protein [Proteobacteria bacterium]|nr:helix-turn-helix domain-containing protein [Pseudomonadota bacterium]
MKTKKKLLFLQAQKTLAVLGDNIKLARLRRRLSMQQVSERAGISRSTLVKIESGNDGVSIGSYFQVLSVLRLDDDLLLVAKDDVLGRKIQDAGLIVKKRAPKRTP